MLSIKRAIDTKKRGKELSKEEIEEFIKRTVDKSLHEAQIGAMLMAICLKGLSFKEVQHLTYGMAHSGKVMEWPSEWKGKVVDKHSTGGVGDKISLVLVPALAALGMKVPMVSGRSLGFTGGTLDKIESIPGFRVELEFEEIVECLDQVGCCIAGQTEEFNPADRVIYNRRDITQTVDEQGLIIASIISKKGAESLDALVIDVKYGKAAHAKTNEEARELAKNLIGATKPFNTRTSAVLSRMDNPIGRAIGNSLEVIESIEALKGRCPVDTHELVTILGGQLLFLAQKTKTAAKGAELIAETLQDGTALKVFKDMLEFQGVSPEVATVLCDNDSRDKSYSVLPKAPYQTDICYDGMPGYISSCCGRTLAELSPELGNDPGCGYELLKVAGDKINPGESWLRVHHLNLISNEFKQLLKQSVAVSNNLISNPLRRIHNPSTDTIS